MFPTDAKSVGSTLLSLSGDPGTQDQALAHLNARGFVQFHPLLASKLDNFKAAIFLGHALYWSRHLALTQPHKRGWFFLTAREAQEATSLSAREQTAVRELLVQKGLIEEALAGRPAKLHFKVNLPAVTKLLDPQGMHKLSWETITKLFQSSTRFYKPLADVAGSAAAGLYLSHLLMEQRKAFQYKNSPFLASGEFVIRPEDVRIALSLGIKAQRNARDKLKSAGLIQEGRAHLEHVSVRINLAAILACVQAQTGRKLRQSKSAPVSNAPTQEPSLRLVPAAAKAAVNELKQSAPDLPETGATMMAAHLDSRGRQLNLFGAAMLAANATASKHASMQPVSSTQAVMNLFAGTPIQRVTAPDSPEKQFALLSKLNCLFVETYKVLQVLIQQLQGLWITLNLFHRPVVVVVMLIFQLPKTSPKSRNPLSRKTIQTL